MAETYSPFPSAMEHQLRELATMFGANAKNVSEHEDAVYTLRKALATAYATGHQDGYLQGRTEKYLVNSTLPDRLDKPAQ